MIVLQKGLIKKPSPIHGSDEAFTGCCTWICETKYSLVLQTERTGCTRSRFLPMYTISQYLIMSTRKELGQPNNKVMHVSDLTS